VGRSSGRTAGQSMSSTGLMSMARRRTSACDFARAHGFDSRHSPDISTQDANVLFLRIGNTKFVITQRHRQRRKVEHIVFIVT
jgi:hypothetical protein